MCAFADTYREWWADISARRPPNTARQYRYHVLRAIADIGRDLRDLSRPALKRYLGDLSRQHADVVQSALADFYGFCVRRGLRTANPLEELPRPKIPRRRLRRALSPEELARLVVAAVWVGHGRERWTGQRLAWTVIAHYASGLRPGELLALGVVDVSLNGTGSEIAVRASKTANARIVPLGDLGREAFAELARARAGRIAHWGTSEYWRKVKRAMLAAGVPEEKARPYALRHSFATHLLQRGVSPRIVAELLGHVDLRHIAGYTVPAGDELRRAVDLLG